MAKPSKFRSIMSRESRYRFVENPLSIILNESLQKSFQMSAEQTEIERIMDAQLTQEFSLGGHADYDYLLDEIQDEQGFENHRIHGVQLCSLFVDLRNFTKRALFIDDPGIETLSEIASLKQRAISTWIRLARYYQGHIHSITGDGIMVLIGGNQPYDADEWTIGARAFLLALRIIESTDTLNAELKELLRQKGQEAHFTANNVLDIKVGIEYSYSTLMNPQGLLVNLQDGVKAIGEVKATSFEVDFSAKILKYYDDAKGKLSTTPKYGRLLLVGEKYVDLMGFTDEIKVELVGTYSKQMFGVSKQRNAYCIDCATYKNEVINLEHVAGLCDVYDASEKAKSVSFEVVNDREIRHG